MKVDPALFARYSWTGRSIKYHRSQIRKVCGTRPPTEDNAGRWAQWLAEEICPTETNRDRLAAALRRRCRSEKAEPPSVGQVERVVVASGCRRFDDAFAATTRWYPVVPGGAKTRARSRLRSSAGGAPSTCSTFLKDAAFITGFTDSFTFVASREVLDRATLNRLLLVLFALGTNMGIRQMAVTGERHTMTSSIWPVPKGASFWHFAQQVSYAAYLWRWSASPKLGLRSLSFPR